MNAITHPEVEAINPVSVIPAQPAQHMLLVPLSQLRPSKRNVRKTLGASITELAASVERVGLLQNLTVTLASDGEHYEVVAGGRRLAALKLLAKKKLKKDKPFLTSFWPLPEPTRSASSKLFGNSFPLWD